MKKIKYALFIFIKVFIFIPSWAMETSQNSLPKKLQTLKNQAPNIDEKVLKLSLIAYFKARERGFDDKQILTIIDYSKPSYEKRLWVFDLKNNHSLYNTWVSHGKNSGNTNSTSFSNSMHSLKSSIGVFVTGETYFGKVGYGLQLKGLESGFNDNAYRRATVFHGARYVNKEVIKKYGRIGRSWGCPAVSINLAKPIINTIKNNTIIFAYYPNSKWLSQSEYLI